MSHLNAETIARLVDEAPSALEQVHLDECAECRGALATMRADVATLGTLGEMTPAADAWPALEARLAAEGLLRRESGRRYAPLLRLAAALALFLTGTLAGFAWRGTMSVPAEPVNVDAQTVAANPTRANLDATNADAASTDAANTNAAGSAAAPGTNVWPETAPALTENESSVAATPSPRAPAPALALIGDTNDPDAAENLPRITGPVDSNARFASYTDVQPRTPQEAAVLLREAESAYLNALTHYSQLAGRSAEGIDPLARLAALEGIVLTTREALGRAPADPIINGYHMTALAQREATLQQIATSNRNPWF